MNRKSHVADERGQVVLDLPHEVAYWTGHLGVTEQALRDAVAAVGHDAPAVRRHLAGRAGAAPEDDAAGAVPLNPGDEAAPGTPGTGDAICRECGGSGQRLGQACPACGGSGHVTAGIGGA